MNPEVEPSSFRDPAGTVFHHEGRVYRALGTVGKKAYEAVEGSGLLSKLISTGLVVDSRRVPSDTIIPSACAQDAALVLEHDKAPFISYACEWSFEMLRAAALTHLRIMGELVGAGFILKDSSVFNYQFFGPVCKLIDIASMEPRKPTDPWLGYTQFCRHFLYPLLLGAGLKISPQMMMRAQPEGLTVADANALLPFWKQLRMRALFDVWL